MELNEEDKERIEQAAKEKYGDHEGIADLRRFFTDGAEYATTYEREQQAEAREHWNRGTVQLFEQVAKLEAERSELRNKVIEEAIEHLNSPLLNFSDGLIYKETVIDLLNSLKTQKP